MDSEHYSAQLSSAFNLMDLEGGRRLEERECKLNRMYSSQVPNLAMATTTQGQATTVLTICLAFVRLKRGTTGLGQPHPSAGLLAVQNILRPWWRTQRNPESRGTPVGLAYRHAVRVIMDNAFRRRTFKVWQRRLNTRATECLARPPLCA